jgi:hypothetical protein
MNDEDEKYEFWIARQDLSPDVQHLYPDGALVIMDGANVVEMVNITEKKAKSGIETRQALKLSYDEYRKIVEERNPRQKFYFSQMQNEENAKCKLILPLLGDYAPRWFYARLDSSEVVQYTESVELENETPPDQYPDYVFVGIGRFDHSE